jgi:hypothetical protein
VFQVKIKSSHSTQFVTFNAWKTTTKSINKTVIGEKGWSKIFALKQVSLSILITIHSQVMFAVFPMIRALIYRLAVLWFQ